MDEPKGMPAPGFCLTCGAEYGPWWTTDGQVFRATCPNDDGATEIDLRAAVSN